MNKQSGRHGDMIEVSTASACCWKPFSHENRYSQYQRIQVSEVTKRLNEMSPEERQHVFEDIHGVANRKKESLTFIEEHLELFELEIGKVSGKERETYDMAMNMNASYVQNRQFRLKFLRSEEFHVKNATSRIMIHFKYKLELFGKKNLVKDISFDDLSSDVQGLLYRANQQFIGVKDKQGRNVLFVFPELNVPCTWEIFAQARWYQFMVALEEEATQVYGIIVVCFWNERSHYHNSNMKALRFIRQSLPVRLAALHGCHINSNLLSSQLLLMWDMLGKKLQTRIRSHVHDSTTHCLYTLQSFGIDPKNVPLESDGRPNKKKFLKCLEERKAFERRKSHSNEINAETSSTKISTTALIDKDKDSNVTGITPSDMDVILGRGIKFAGNRKLDKIIDLEAASYQNAHTTFDKTIITINTMRYIQESGGRFLKKNKNKNKTYEWIVADDEEARRSISDRFRNKFRF